MMTETQRLILWTVVLYPQLLLTLLVLMYAIVHWRDLRRVRLLGFIRRLWYTHWTNRRV
jgi:hypothetical protein